jgi:hypothetical protein
MMQLQDGLTSRPASALSAAAAVRAFTSCRTFSACAPKQQQQQQQQGHKCKMSASWLLKT